DPEELFADMTEQIFGAGGPAGAANMSGFAQNYMKTPTNDARAVMHGFSPDQLPVLSALAKGFGVSDRWHASAPNQTWPNRFFVHTGTAEGYVNNEPFHFPYLMHTIFNRFKTCRFDRKWRVYFHDFPQSLTLVRLWFHADHFHFYDDPLERHTFKRDAARGLLPSYSFIEPRYFPDPVLRTLPTDQHPPHDV